MRYWWVNQNQTFRQEFRGGFLWSPKRKSDGSRNPFYEFMREVSPGDFIFSFADTLIKAFGIARSHAYEAPKPEEFGNAGRNWDKIGWRIDVGFTEVETRVRPSDHMAALSPLLPKKYSPLLPDGRGSQSIYLTALPHEFALRLSSLLGSAIEAIARTESIADHDATEPRPELMLWEDHLRKEIENDLRIGPTVREALVMARRGQGLFRQGVRQIEHRCRITRVDQPEHLRASHIKPWRDSNNEERLDAENGLLLTPSIDHLFDGGYISFGATGRLLISPVAHMESLAKMGTVHDRPVDVGGFTRIQARYLEYHRDEVFLQARVSSFSSSQ